MRHPFWKWTQWTSWLCVGLSGCLHGQDWRAAVSKPLTRPVADRRESLPQPKVIGPRRQPRTSFVPPTDSPASAAIVSSPVRTAAPIMSGPRVLSSKVSVPAASHMTPSAIMARPPAFTASGMDGASRKAAEAVHPPTTKDEAQPRGVRVHEAGFIPPPAPPAAPPTIPDSIPPQRDLDSVEPRPTGSSAIKTMQPLPDGRGSILDQQPTREVFAEFERTIPRRRASVLPESDVLDKDDEVVVAPKHEPTVPPPLPLIVPARSSVPAIEPDVPRLLPPISAKELPDVSDTITTAPESMHADLEQAARPRDVAVLVEQVFEDLRQRRLDQARQRTAWLKQLVSRREPALEETSAAKQAGIPAEPQQLHVDQSAAPVHKSPSDKLLNDDEFQNRP